MKHISKLSFCLMVLLSASAAKAEYCSAQIYCPNGNTISCTADGYSCTAHRHFRSVDCKAWDANRQKQESYDSCDGKQWSVGKNELQDKLDQLASLGVNREETPDVSDRNSGKASTSSNSPISEASVNVDLAE